MDTNALLLKHGLESLIAENDNAFKQKISQALALKLNNSFKEIKENVSKKLLFQNLSTDTTPELNEFVDFVQNFKPGNYTFKNGSIINILESEMEELKELFESLSPKNRQKMVSEIFDSGIVFKQHIEFSKKAKKLL
jgi:hypothetical protein